MRLGVARALVEGAWVDGDVEVHDGRLAAVGLGAPRGSRIAVPGFVDLQVNGFAGVDFSSLGPGDLERAAVALRASGVTAFQPTLVTAPVEEMRASLAALHATPGGPRLIGAHLEGPFISPDRPGAHDPTAIASPDPDALATLLVAPPRSAAAGRCAITQVTLAPEVPGALALVDSLVDRGIVVSLGHTEADADTAHAAFDRGARAVTHVFNAMRPPAPRDPGVAFAALGRDDVFVTAIVDGLHLAPDTVLAAWRATGECFVLVSDAGAAAGAPDGEYTLGGRVRVRSEGGAVRAADGALAGSTLTMADAVRNLHALGVPLAAALRAASEAPARMARRPDLGRLAIGTPADLVVLDDRLEVFHVRSQSLNR